MLVKRQKLARILQSNLTFRAFSPRKAYCEGSVKSTSHLQKSRFLAASLTVYDVEDLSRSFNYVLSGVSVITIKLPTTEVSGKAAEMRQVYLVCGVTVTECDSSSWVFCSPDEGRKCVHPIHTNVYSIQMFVATLQSIVSRVCTLLIFIHLF